MPFLHPPHVQRFQADKSIFAAQLVGKMPMIGFSLVRYLAVQAGLLLETLLDILAFPEWSLVDRGLSFALFDEMVSVGKKFTGYFLLHLFEFVAIRLEKPWHIHIVFGCRSNKNMVFETKVKPDTFT